MCTAISFTNGDNYFGRNLDLDYEYEVLPNNSMEEFYLAVEKIVSQL